MLTFWSLYKPIPKDSDQSEDIPHDRVNEKPLRRICKCPDFSVQPGHKEKLQAPHLKFGPFYREDESIVQKNAKQEAWKKILEKSVDNNETLEDEEKLKEDQKKKKEAEKETKECYLSAMQGLGKVAMDAYEDSALRALPESEFEFCWMMIEDGCFFLQLALFILGVPSDQLGYPAGDQFIFDQKRKKENTKRLIESMFFVGNQIPLVVLNKLMEQTFFQKILKNHVNSSNVPPEVWKRILYELQTFFQKILKHHVNSWDVPSEVSTRILHELLVLPPTRKGCGGKGNWLAEQRPSDFLHALHIWMFGSGEAGESGPHIESQDEDEDLESGPNMESKDGEYSPNIESKEGKSGPNMESKDRDDDLESGLNMASKDKTLSATELKKKGICFVKSERMGCREIVFRDYILLARLYLPTFAVDDDTEALWKSLKYYEMTQQQKSFKTQQQGNGNCEVRSYLQFMNDLICTNDDVRLLAKKGIIKERSSCDKYELTKILSRLAGKEKITTQKHRLLRIQLRDYGLAPWERFKTLAILIFVLTAIQTIFTVLAYFRTPLQN